MELTKRAHVQKETTVFELWDNAIPIADGILQTSVRFGGREESSLHKFPGAEFRVTADLSTVLIKHQGKYGFIPNTNVRIGYFKPAA